MYQNEYSATIQKGPFLGIVKIGGSLTLLRWFTNPDLP